MSIKTLGTLPTFVDESDEEYSYYFGSNTSSISESSFPYINSTPPLNCNEVKRKTRSESVEMLPIQNSNVPANLSLNKLSFLTFLSDGSNSRLFQAVYDNKLVIIKTLNDESLSNSMAQEDMDIEIAVLCRLQHPHIVNIEAYGFTTSPTHDDLRRPMIALEILNGNTLYYHLNLARETTYGKSPFSMTQGIRIAKELASALSYLHTGLGPDCAVLHRDLKPDNIAFTSTGRAKLIDFGLCTCVRKGFALNGLYNLTGCAGAYRYMAPENALNLPYDEKVDIYGYGLILYEIMTGVLPFGQISKEGLYSEVFHGGCRPDLIEDDAGQPLNIPLKIQFLISQCWNQDPIKRPSANEILSILKTVESNKSYL